MKYLTLYLNAPLMSWSINSKYKTKVTEEYPSKSAIFGMICCSQGKDGEQTEYLKMLNTSLNIDIYCYSNINYLNDFQTIGCNYNEKDRWENLMSLKKNDGKSPVGGGSLLVNKYYITNGKYLVILKSENENLLNEIAEGFKQPVWPIFYGRKCCIPSIPPFVGIYNSIEDAKNETNKYINNILELENEISDKNLKFIISETELENGIVTFKNDVPIQFGLNKIYSTRKIWKQYVN